MPTPFQSLPHFDSQENVFFQRELENVDVRLRDVKYADTLARQLLPVVPCDPAATTYVWQQFDGFGVAKLIAAYGDDAPRSDVSAVETSLRIKEYGIAFGWNIMEIKAAAKANRPLQQKKAENARRILEEKVDTIGFGGDSEAGLYGISNQPNASSYVIPNGASASPLWANKTPDEILNDMHGIFNSIRTNTNDVERGDTLLLPSAQYQLINTKRANTYSDATILQVFLKNSPDCKSVQPWNRLKGVGAGSTDRMIAYKRDLEACGMLIPIDYEQLPPQPHNYEMLVNVFNRLGGVVLYYPLTMVYGDGI